MGGAIFGKVVINGRIKLKTGLHIGAQTEAIEIGGLDNPILKNPNTGKPYIPGSSLKGKMRCLFEKSKITKYPPELRGPPSKDEKDESKYFLNKNIGTANNPIWIHVHLKPKPVKFVDCLVALERRATHQEPFSEMPIYATKRLWTKLSRSSMKLP